jgi:hypothetical protein
MKILFSSFAARTIIYYPKTDRYIQLENVHKIEVTTVTKMEYVKSRIQGFSPGL